MILDYSKVELLQINLLEKLTHDYHGYLNRKRYEA